MELIFDSNVFDELITGKFNIDFIIESEIKIFITHVQVDELNECPDKERRGRLFNCLTKFRPKKISTEAFVIGKSRIGSAKIGDGKLIKKWRINNPKKINDALIGETAIKNNIILVTNDRCLKNRVIKLGGQAVTVSELIKMIKS